VVMVESQKSKVVIMVGERERVAEMRERVSLCFSLIKFIFLSC
jgi:hypothetical protein